jgi:outer membrane protein assembly factor BamB
MKLLPALLAIATLGAPLPGKDDPSWRLWGGPSHDFRSTSTGLADSWPEAGPRRLWSRDLGDGYSAIAVENGVLYTAYRRGDDEVFVALSAADGKTIWEHSYPAPFKNSYAEKVGPGPYAMPQIVGGSVFIAGATGKIYTLDKATGKPLWFHDLYEEFHGTKMVFGYSSHPLPYQGNLIAQLGGEGNSILALRQNDGAVVWRSQTFKNSHSSPILINVDGQDQVVVLTADEVLGLEPHSGELLWRHPHLTSYGLACATPVWRPGNILLISSSYNGGTRVIHLKRSGGRTIPEELWFNGKIYVHFGSIIADGDTIYASSGHSGPVFLMGFNVKTGEILWRNRDFAKAQILWSDGKLIILDEDGNLGLATPTPVGLRVHAKIPLLAQISWTSPTLVGSILYIRDRRTIAAYDLKRR